MLNIEKCMFCGENEIIKQSELLDTIEGKRVGIKYYCNDCLRTLQYTIINPMGEE